MQFDPVDLRTKRQAALANAMAQPLLGKNGREGSAAREVSYVEQYPFVFDSQAKTKTAAGKTSSVKLYKPKVC